MHTLLRSNCLKLYFHWRNVEPWGGDQRYDDDGHLRPHRWPTQNGPRDDWESLACSLLRVRRKTFVLEKHEYINF